MDNCELLFGICIALVGVQYSACVTEVGTALSGCLAECALEVEFPLLAAACIATCVGIAAVGNFYCKAQATLGIAICAGLYKVCEGWFPTAVATGTVQG